MERVYLGQIFFISWFTDTPTVIIWKVEIKKNYILSADSKY